MHIIKRKTEKTVFVYRKILVVVRHVYLLRGKFAVFRHGLYIIAVAAKMRYGIF